MTAWKPIEEAPKYDVVDLWGSEEPDGGLMRWPDCWWGPQFPDAGYAGHIEEGWYCRLGRGNDPFRVYPTHFMLIPLGPI